MEKGSWKEKKLDDASERDKRRLLDEFHISTVLDLRSVYVPLFHIYTYINVYILTRSVGIKNRTQNRNPKTPRRTRPPHTRRPSPPHPRYKRPPCRHPGYPSRADKPYGEGMGALVDMEVGLGEFFVSLPSLGLDWAFKRKREGIGKSW